MEWLAFAILSIAAAAVIVRQRRELRRLRRDFDSARDIVVTDGMAYLLVPLGQVLGVIGTGQKTGQESVMEREP